MARTTKQEFQEKIKRAINNETYDQDDRGDRDVVSRSTSDQPTAQKKEAPQTPPNAEDPGHERKPPQPEPEPEIKPGPPGGWPEPGEPKVTTTDTGDVTGGKAMDLIKRYWWAGLIIVMAYFIFFRKEG